MTSKNASVNGGLGEIEDECHALMVGTVSLRLHRPGSSKWGPGGWVDVLLVCEGQTLLQNMLGLGSFGW